MQEIRSQTNKKSVGFTIVELLVVIGVLAILLTITLIALNPSDQFAKSRNAKRQSNVSAILNAVKQYSANKNGYTGLNLPIDTEVVINSSGAPGTIDLCGDLTPGFIPRMPFDPIAGSWSSCNNYNTGYTIMLDSSGRIQVKAPSAEQQVEITVRQ